MLSQAKAGTQLGFRRRIAHSGSQGETGAFRAGVVSLPSEALPKNAESLRNSDALMRVAVPKRRGPAGLRDPVSALWIMW